MTDAELRDCARRVYEKLAKRYPVLIGRGEEVERVVLEVFKAADEFTGETIATGERMV